ncbi:MAG: RNB domain-containing ribonuclease [Deltaproteobacteria bacterium]|nr:RNB domain-containing ribonuclease [Deltaproteobacteria bacterium]
MAEKSRTGRIVDLVEPGRERLELAWIREEAKGKARLRTAGGREHSLSSRALDEATVADHGPAGPDALESLARRDAEVEAQRASIAAEEVELLWESLAGDDDERRALGELALELLGPQAPAARVSALGRALEADGDRFALWARGSRFTVFGRRTRQARVRREADEAERREEDARRRAAETEQADALAARIRPLLAPPGAHPGSPPSTSHQPPATSPVPWPADLDPFLDGLLALSRLDRTLDDSPADDALPLRVARAVAARLEGSDEARSVRALAERLLLLRRPGASRTLRARLLLGLGDEFPAAAAAEAAAAAPVAVDVEDLTGLSSCAIDDPWTRLRDDALAVLETDGTLEVLVHVADAATSVPCGGPLDAAAMRRGTAHFWPDGVIPMLPAALAESRLSLDADGAPRRAFTIRFRCAADDRGPTLELVRLGFSLVRITANRTYEDVDAALAAPAGDDDRLLARLWEHLAAVRRRRVPLDEPPRTEARLVVEGDGERIDLRTLAVGTPARRLIEELALASGMAAAGWAREHHVPLIYRVQDAPAIGRRPSRATYTLTPDEHHAMGGALYAHVTSPLRRYVDLLNQRQLAARLTGGAVRADPQVDLQRITLGIRDVLDRARDLGRDAQRYWALRWLALRRDEVFDAELRLEPQTLDGSRPPRVMVLPVSVLLPVDGSGPLFEAARSAPAPGSAASGRAPAPPAAIPVRVRVAVADAESLSARAAIA